MKVSRRIAAVGVIAALGLAACSSSSPAVSPSSAPTIAAPAAPAPAPTSQAQVVRDVLAEHGIVVPGDDASIDAAGAALVNVFDTVGVSAAVLLELSSITADAFGLPLEDGAYIVGVLVGGYAPQYVDDVSRVLSGSSTTLN